MESISPIFVGIGASAGGIPALEGFLRAFVDSDDIVVAIVTHLSPDRRSLLHEIIEQYTALPVVVIEDGMPALAQHVYVMPERAVLSVKAGYFVLTDDDPLQRERKPVDVFFSSLALDQGETAVAIVLSGGDGDGTLGIKAVKEGGGFTMAQASNGSVPRNPEMPNSAMATGLIDFAEQVEDMPSRIVQIRDGIAGSSEAVETPSKLGETKDDMQVHAEIARILRGHSGRDFAGYKSMTFMRRVFRRMSVLQISEVENYIQRLHVDPQEVSALFRDLLINVTSFFRDAEAFELLRPI